jgi:hypothetical protein
MRSAKMTKAPGPKARTVQPPGYVEGASASLTLSMEEIEAVLGGIVLGPPGGPLRKELRAKISELSKRWFRRGFRRGCIETQRDWKATGKFPKKVTYDARRDFFDGRKRPVNVSWPSK